MGSAARFSRQKAFLFSSLCARYFSAAAVRVF